MELHRKSSGPGSGLTIIGFGILAILVPYLLSLVGRSFLFGPLFWWIGGGIAVLAGCWGVYEGVRGFRIRIDESGVFADTALIKVTLPWESIEAVTIQKLSPTSPEKDTSHLIVWQFAGREPATKPNFRDQATGRRAYNIVDLGSVVESPEELAEGLRHYAGVRYVSGR